jgi:hypothetical protein
MLARFSAGLILFYKEERPDLGSAINNWAQETY